MQNRSKAIIGVGGGLAVIAGIVVGVQLLGGSGGGVGRAADVLPAKTTYFTFVDRDAWAERAGVDDIGHGASEDDLATYIDASRDSSVGSPLATYLDPMQDAAFSELDVDWEVTGGSAPGGDSDGFWSVYRMDDELDLDQAVDSMEDAGWSKDDLDGNPRLTLDIADSDEAGLAGDYPAAPLMDVTFVEDEHLMIVSGNPEQILDVVSGDADSLADDDTVDDLLDQVDDVELADVRLGDDACRGQRGQQTPPEQEAQLLEQSGMGDLGSARATGYFQEADGDDSISVGVLAFSSDDAADDDAGARQKWLTDGVDPTSATPMSEYLDLDDVESDGKIVVARGTFDPENVGFQMYVRSGGLTACAASD